MGPSLRKLAVNLIPFPRLYFFILDLPHLPQMDHSNPYFEVYTGETKVGTSSINFGLLHQDEEAGK